MLIDGLIPAQVRVSVERQRLGAIVSCLEERGFHVIRPDFTSLGESVALQYTLERIVYGVPANYSGSLGIGRWALAASRPRIVAPAENYGPAFTQAQIGNVRDTTLPKISFETEGGVISFAADGCIGQSYLEVFGSEEAIGIYTQLPRKLQSDIDSLLDSSDRIESSVSSWSKCAAAQGLKYESPREAVFSVAEAYSNSDPSTAANLEGKVLGLLKACELESGLFAEVMRQLPRVEDVILSSNAAALDEFKKVAETAARTSG